MTKEREEDIRKIWQGNAFMQVLKLKIENINDGNAILSMPIDFDIHTNHWLGVHGGALAALADSVGGIVCASVGKIAQTLNMNINYISNTKGMGSVIAIGQIAHAGKSTIVIHTQIKDDRDTLMCDISSIMFISGELDEMKV